MGVAANKIQASQRRKINRLIGYGILIFFIALVTFYWFPFMKYFIPIGTILTYYGSFLFLKNTNLREEFKFENGMGFLTYFWDKLALKIWTIIFLLSMLGVNLSEFFGIFSY